jgi:deazaflavin-dependent oxidoreductase (nitroreductase family)
LSQPKDQAEPAFLYLTTTGRLSGQPREIEIWFAEHRHRYYLIAELRERANWVRNILHDSRVLFRVRDDVSAGTGRVVDAQREAELWAEVRALFDKKYGWSDGLIVELSRRRTQGPP